MPRLKTIPRDEQPELEALFKMVEEATGYVPNSLLQMGVWPALANAFTGLAVTVLGPSEHVPSDLKQMIALVTSQAAGCQYCMAHTAHSAAAAGADIGKIEKVWEFESSALFSDAERVVLGIARDSAQIPNAVNDADFEMLKSHYSERQIIEIMGVISIFGFLNRWNDTLATTLEALPLNFGKEHLGTSGWDPKKHLEAPDD